MLLSHYLQSPHANIFMWASYPVDEPCHWAILSFKLLCDFPVNENCPGPRFYAQWR